MEKIIKKAIIEGGYEFIKRSGEAQIIEVFGARRFGKATAEMMLNTYIVCDPLFWQALGKACGWGSTGLHKWCLCDKNKDLEWMEWHMYALNFYEINLTEGWKKAVEYLSELIKDHGKE